MGQYTGIYNNTHTIHKSKTIKPHFILGDELEALKNPKLYQAKREVKERTKGMKRKILTFIEDLKSVRKDCVEACENLCKDTNLSHEGKINQMNTNIRTLKEWAEKGSSEIIQELESRIETIDRDEAAAYKKKRESADYAACLSSTAKILAEGGKDIPDADIKLAVSQFEDDPFAVQTIKKALTDSGMNLLEASDLVPKDTRGRKQEMLRRVINNVQSSVSMLTDVKFQESGFAGGFEVNGFNISLPELVLFDMAFIDSLNDDCTGENGKGNTGSAQWA